MEKFTPEVGTKLYLKQKTGNSWVDSVKHPYTVIATSSHKILVQHCKLIFDGPAYYDTLPDKIEADPQGSTVELIWSVKNERWQAKGEAGSYPRFAVFGEWVYEPYLN